MYVIVLDPLTLMPFLQQWVQTVEQWQYALIGLVTLRTTVVMT